MVGENEGSFGLRRANVQALKEIKERVLVVACSNDYRAQDSMISNFEKFGVAHESIRLCRTNEMG